MFHQQLILVTLALNIRFNLCLLYQECHLVGAMTGVTRERSLRNVCLPQSFNMSQRYNIPV